MSSYIPPTEMESCEITTTLCTIWDFYIKGYPPPLLSTEIIKLVKEKSSTILGFLVIVNINIVIKVDELPNCSGYPGIVKNTMNLLFSALLPLCKIKAKILVKSFQPLLCVTLATECIFLNQVKAPLYNPWPYSSKNFSAQKLQPIVCRSNLSRM